ncbi:MAG TPA: amidohydrolase family protein [Chloroflexia bacterium]|nr:amidohydrolase family protein [Chloroflexia bacterium]
MTRILLENCAIFSHESPELLEDQHVLIQNDRIVEVSDKPIKSEAEVRLNLAGRALLPGLTDAHVHVTAVSADLGSMYDLSPTLIAAKTRPILEDMLMRGFTTVRDAGGADWGIAEAVRSGLFKGPRLLYSGHALSQTGGHGDPRSRNNDGENCCYAPGILSRVVDGVDAVRKAARDELRKGATQLKIMASGGVASPTDHIANTQYSTDEVRAIVQEARAARTYVMAHAYTARAIRHALEAGVRSIEHGNLVDLDTARLMVEKEAFMVPTLVTYEMLYRLGRQFGVPQVSLDKLSEVRDYGLQALEICKKVGVKIGHGSDLLGEMHEHQSFEFSIKAEVLSPHEVITAATATNAELFNLQGEIGVVAPGALADLIVVEGNPLKDLNLLQEQGKHLSLIMQQGKLVKNTLA